MTYKLDSIYCVGRPLNYRPESVEGSRRVGGCGEASDRAAGAGCRRV
jgi:hypothetical protein